MSHLIRSHFNIKNKNYLIQISGNDLDKTFLFFLHSLKKDIKIIFYYDNQNKAIKIKTKDEKIFKQFINFEKKYLNN